MLSTRPKQTDCHARKLLQLISQDSEFDSVTDSCHNEHLTERTQDLKHRIPLLYLILPQVLALTIDYRHSRARAMSQKSLPVVFTTQFTRALFCSQAWQLHTCPEDTAGSSCGTKARSCSLFTSAGLMTSTSSGFMRVREKSFVSPPPGTQTISTSIGKVLTNYTTCQQTKRSQTIPAAKQELTCDLAHQSLTHSTCPASSPHHLSKQYS